MNIAHLFVLIDIADHLLYQASHEEQTEEVKAERIQRARSELWTASGIVQTELDALSEKEKLKNEL